MTDQAGWAALGAAVFATYFWRVAGIVVASRIKPDSDLAKWFTAVAYAVLAGLIARMIVLQDGALASAPVPDKIAGLAIGLTAYFIGGRNVPLGTASAFIAFAVLAFIRAAVGG